MELLSHHRPDLVPDHGPDARRAIGPHGRRHAPRPLQGRHALASLDLFNRLERPVGHPNPCSDRDAVSVALVALRIGIAFEVGEAQAGAVRGSPDLLGFVVRPAERREQLAAALDRVGKLGARAPHHEAAGVLAVAPGVGNPFTEHPVGFSAAPRATEKDLEYIAGQQGDLGAGLGSPDDDAAGG